MRRRIWIGQLLVAVPLGCGGDKIDSVDVQPLPSLRWPSLVDAAAVGPNSGMAPTRDDAVLMMSSCVRRSQARFDEIWARIRRDLDPATGLPLRERKEVWPWVPSLRADLAPCNAPDMRGSAPPLPPALLERFDAFREATLGLAEDVDALARYFDEQTYATDDWDFARTMLPTLTQKREAWLVLVDALEEELGPARRSAVEALVQERGDTDEGDPTTTALRLLELTDRIASCLEGPALTHCAAFRADIDDRVAALVAWLDAHTEEAPFWSHALAKASREFARTYAAVEGSLRRGKLLPSQRDALTQAQRRLENAAETARRQTL